MPLASWFFVTYNLICERQRPQLHKHLHIHKHFSSIFSWLSNSTIAFSSKIFSKEFFPQNIAEENLFIRAEAFPVLSLTAYQGFVFCLWFSNTFGFHNLGALNSSLIHRAKSIHLFLTDSTRRKSSFLVWERSISKVQAYCCILWGGYRWPFHKLCLLCPG
jgi:hypothetical protein